jgi:PAS domain S-box-containing protein
MVMAGAAANAARSCTPDLNHPLELADRVLDLLPVAVYVCDLDGLIVRFNRKAAKLWGRAPKVDDPSERFCGSHRLFRLDGSFLPHAECPMADVLRSGEPVRDQQVVIERSDGSRGVVLVNIEALRDDAGGIAGAVNCFVEITDHKWNDRAPESELDRPYLIGQDPLQLAAIVTSSEDAIISKDINGIIVSWNGGAENLYGYAADEVIGKPITIIIPSDRLDEEATILAQIQRGEPVDRLETIRRRKNGSLVEVSLTISPVKDAKGNIVGASKIARDITERKRAQERQALLLREINHRVKNVFALAGSLVVLSARSAQTPADMATALQSRLVALSRAHDLTLPDLTTDATADKATMLLTIVETISSPYTSSDRPGHRFVTRGPAVRVGRKAVTAFALLLHEFATNAAKYGALSVPDGHVDVEWTIDGNDLHLTWREHGGPPPAVSSRSEGFGSLLTRATVTGQLGGKILHEWKAEGLSIQLAVPLRALT